MPANNNMAIPRFPVRIVALLGLAMVLFSSFVQAQRRDYMTDAEIELVRQAQDIDERVNALIKMIDRRFAALGVTHGGWTESGKDADRWGDPPKGTRAELLLDIKKLMQKAVDDIDNLAEHPNAAPIRDESERSSKQAKRDARRLPDSVRALAAASKRYQPLLKGLYDKTDEDKERGPILDASDLCDQVIAAAAQLPAAEK